MVSMRKLHEATIGEIKAMASRFEAIEADGVIIGKLAPVDYQAKRPINKQVSSPSTHRQVDNQARVHANSFGIVPKSLL